jgi:hypothetical protein
MQQLMGRGHGKPVGGSQRQLTRLAVMLMRVMQQVLPAVGEQGEGKLWAVIQQGPLRGNR